MYYKQFSSGGQLIAVGETVDNTILPKYYSQISKSEYESLKRIFMLDSQEKPKLTPLNEKGELIYASV